MGLGWGGDSVGGQLVHNIGSRAGLCGTLVPPGAEPWAKCWLTGPLSGRVSPGRRKQFQLVVLASATSARCH